MKTKNEKTTVEQAHATCGCLGCYPGASAQDMLELPMAAFANINTNSVGKELAGRELVMAKWRLVDELTLGSRVAAAKTANQEARERVSQTAKRLLKLSLGQLRWLEADKTRKRMVARYYGRGGMQARMAAWERAEIKEREKEMEKEKAAEIEAKVMAANQKKVRSKPGRVGSYSLGKSWEILFGDARDASTQV